MTASQRICSPHHDLATSLSASGREIPISSSAHSAIQDQVSPRKQPDQIHYLPRQSVVRSSRVGTLQQELCLRPIWVIMVFEQLRGLFDRSSRENLPVADLGLAYVRLLDGSKSRYSVPLVPRNPTRETRGGIYQRKPLAYLPQKLQICFLMFALCLGQDTFVAVEQQCCWTDHQVLCVEGKGLCSRIYTTPQEAAQQNLRELYGSYMSAHRCPCHFG